MSVWHDGKVIKVSELVEGENDIDGAKIVRSEGMTDAKAYETFDDPQRATSTPHVESYGKGTTVVVGKSLTVNGEKVISKEAVDDASPNCTISVKATGGGTAYACLTMNVEHHVFK